MHQNQFKLQSDSGEKEFLMDLHLRIYNDGQDLSQRQEVEILKKVVDRQIKILGQ